MGQKPKIFALSNSTGCKLWRLNPQLRYLIGKGYEVKTIEGKGRRPWDEIIGGVMWADIIILQSVFDQRIIKMAKEGGKKVIFEFDDLVDEVPPKHPAYESVMSPLWRRDMYRAIEQADILITTNENLKKRFEPLNKNIYIFPNYVDREYWEKPYNPNYDSDQIRMGWAGGISHAEDLEMIAPVVGKILEKCPKVKFVYCGDGGAWAQNKFHTFLYGEDHFTEIPPERREYVLSTPADNWADKLNSLQLDLAIAPLVKNNFSVCKTPIKWMEYGINKVPSVCQGFMYSQVIKDGVDGFLAETPDEWIKALSKLIESKQLRKKMGIAAYKKIIKDYDIKKHLSVWEDIILKDICLKPNKGSVKKSAKTSA